MQVNVDCRAIVREGNGLFSAKDGVIIQSGQCFDGESYADHCTWKGKHDGSGAKASPIMKADRKTPTQKMAVMVFRRVGGSTGREATGCN